MSTRLQLAAYIGEHCITRGLFNLPRGWQTTAWIDLSPLVGDQQGRSLFTAAFTDRLALLNRTLPGFTILGSTEQDFPLTAVLGYAANLPCFAIGGPNQGLRELPDKSGSLRGTHMRGEEILLIDDVSASGETCRRLVQQCNMLGLRVAAIMPLVDACPNEELKGFCDSAGIKYLPLLMAADLGLPPNIAPPPYASAAPPAQTNKEMLPKDAPTSNKPSVADTVA